MSATTNPFAPNPKAVLVHTSMLAHQIREAAGEAYDNRMDAPCRDLHLAAHAVEAAIVKARQAAKARS